MRIQRLAISLMAINLVLLVFNLPQYRPAEAQTIAPVLRARALEIVDAQGRVRASITVEPPVTVNGKLYPETVLLRLADPKSGPVVKLTASEQGATLGLSDDAQGGVVLSAKVSGSFVRVVSHDGREQIVKP
jgi:hypothetical protein